MYDDRCLIVLTGPTASGKSTIAKWLEQRWDDTVAYHSAEIRRELHLMPEDIGYEFDLSNNTFVESVSGEVYEEMRSRAGETIDDGGCAVIDGSHRLRQQRLLSYNVGLNRDVPVVLVACECNDTDAIKQRLAERRDREDAFAEATEFSTYESTKEEAEPITGDPPVERREVGIVRYDSERGLVEIEQEGSDARVVTEIHQELQALLDGRRFN
ncbi:AAA family ATPase [Halorubrum distributum]|nr:AAA family ATPase [Halorubrum distributum]